MKQTSIEWLLQRFEDGDMYNVEDAQFIKHQALAMEKEQIEDGYQAGLWCPNHLEITKPWAEQYYNKTYKGGEK